MEIVCPACNKLETKNIKCKNCQMILTDKGRAQEVFQDDYTANMPINDAANYCVHVFECEHCGNKENIALKKVAI